MTNNWQLKLPNPNIPETYRISMILYKQWQLAMRLIVRQPHMLDTAFDFSVVLNQHPIMHHRHICGESSNPISSNWGAV